jgi:hypothetical protein
MWFSPPKALRSKLQMISLEWMPFSILMPTLLQYPATQLNKPILDTCIRRGLCDKSRDKPAIALKHF